MQFIIVAGEFNILRLQCLPQGTLKKKKESGLGEKKGKKNGGIGVAPGINWKGTGERMKVWWSTGEERMRFPNLHSSHSPLVA